MSMNRHKEKYTQCGYRQKKKKLEFFGADTKHVYLQRTGSPCWMYNLQHALLKNRLQSVLLDLCIPARPKPKFLRTTGGSALGFQIRI